ncbi:GNAT family N-acetyltransferase [Pedobacter sp. KR3-3]|uniref:GNAT family N-acetyltransferase n=1 Tax=Pedobacter albus TaxID=3113905 RepID=A0ABU7ICK9_9SPHI|nr:GNAT family N-acetyltransferase [Pedobacter sp. KR3-3]MEE1947107.1 GNAT family N-acetyltransferase [Pedobacter sp. KR3-3]
MKISIQKLDTINETEAQQLCELTTQLGYTNEPTAFAKRLQHLINSKADCIFIALADDKIVGWIHGAYQLTLESPPFVEILGLVVDADFRGQQIGKRLVDAVKIWSQAFEVEKIRVRCNIIRLASHEFYKRLGFEENKRQAVFDWKFVRR